MPQRIPEITGPGELLNGEQPGKAAAKVEEQRAKQRYA